TTGNLNGTFGGQTPGAVPAVGITQRLGEKLLEAVETEGAAVTLHVQTQLDEIETFNLLAETPKGRTDNVVMVGAHLDGVEDGAGINDNGSGSAAILETAVQLAEVNKLNNQVRFAWWGAEEHGLLGSWHYVEDLYANDPDS